MMAVLLILAKGKPWWWLLPHMAALVVLGSRGAVLGLAVGLVAWYRPRINLRRALLLVVLGAALLVGLTAYRPGNAINRISYWKQATRAWLRHDPWLGLGLGGIYVRSVVLEPGRSPYRTSSYQPQVHNILMQVLVETGIVGVFAFAAAAAWALRGKLEGQVQWAILAAILAHCMVDLPIYYPGPLLLFMLLAGSLRRSKKS
jgi:O-antigen ligase